MQAVIFDMDGVLSDTQRLHAEVETGLLAELGVTTTPEELTFRYAGIRAYEMWSDLCARYGLEISAEEGVRRKAEAVMVVTETHLRPIPGAVELVAALHAEGVPLAVASSSTSDYVGLVLERLGVRRYFDAVVCGDEVERGKPDPEIFLRAARKLGASPDGCVVVEDGRSGMEAARSAGMKCIGLVPLDGGVEYPADLLVHDLRDLTPELMREL